MPRPLEKRSLRPEGGGSRCAECGQAFECGFEAGASSCWCAGLPARLPVPEKPAGCYCRKCLEKLLASGAGRRP